MDTGKSGVRSLAILSSNNSFALGKAALILQAPPTAEPNSCRHGENPRKRPQSPEFVVAGRLRPSASHTAGDCTQKGGYDA
jgi:hypothetical protein